MFTSTPRGSFFYIDFKSKKELKKFALFQAGAI